MQSEMLNLAGGSGEREPSPIDPLPEKEWISVFSEEQVRAATDGELLAVYRDLAGFDMEGDPTLAMVRKELERRKLLGNDSEVRLRGVGLKNVVPFAPRQ